MFQVNDVVGVTILTPDVVRMNSDRSEGIRNFAKTSIGKDCNAFAFAGADGLINKVELWGGDETQRKAFVEGLHREVYH